MEVAAVVKDREFNVERAWGRYERFIKKLRRDLRATGSHNLPVLPRQSNPPTEWFNITLHTSTHHITLKIRRDNVYLDGYRMMEDSNPWLEFGTNNNDNSHLIPDSIFLGFDGSYGSLETAAKQGRRDIPLGKPQLVKAVNTLAISTYSQQRAKALIVVIQMICESIRITYVTNHVKNLSSTGSPADDIMAVLENGWEGISAALLLSDRYPDRLFPIPQVNPMRIVDAETASRHIGIMLNPNSISWNTNNDRYGQPLVDVLSVIINNDDGERQAYDLYGTIKVTDWLRSQYLYNREKANYESIKPGERATLTGPDVWSTSAYWSFVIDLDLKDKDKLSPDDQVSHGQISFNPQVKNAYDLLLSQEIPGRHGSATVNYIIYSHAMQATVEIVFINGAGEGPAEVHGDITTTASRFPASETTIFSKSDGHYIDVYPTKTIPLSRTIVAVPVNSSLKVKVNLMDHRFISTDDDEIAGGIKEFLPRPYTSSAQRIAGRHGEIEVTVTWI